jgi:hypothetical protein
VNDELGKYVEGLWQCTVLRYCPIIFSEYLRKVTKEPQKPQDSLQVDILTVDLLNMMQSID